jgi:hypothetical protein
MHYEALIHCLLPGKCALSKPVTDEGKPLFRVTVVLIETEETDDNQATTLQQAITLPALPWSFL